MDAAIGRMVRTHAELDLRARGLHWSIHRACGGTVHSEQVSPPKHFEPLLKECRRRAEILSVLDQQELDAVLSQVENVNDLRNRCTHDVFFATLGREGFQRAGWAPAGSSLRGPSEAVTPTNVDDVTEEIERCGQLVSALSGSINQRSVGHWVQD